MDPDRLTIGKLAKRVGIPPKTLRYYEEVGLLPPPERSEGGYRLYSELDVRRADLVGRARALGMGLDEIRTLVEFAATGDCGEFQDRFVDLIRKRTEDVGQRIADLQRLERDLVRLEHHLEETRERGEPDHTVLECSPETCTCFGEVRLELETASASARSTGK